MPELTSPAVAAGTVSGVEQPVLGFDGFEVRPWLAEDLTALVEAYAAPDIRQWHARTMTSDEAAEWIAQRSQRWADERGADWAVVDADGVVGRVGLRTMDLAGGLGEAAYWTMPAARGRGVAVGALRTMSEWWFGEIGLHRLDVLHSTANPASCRVAEKAGFAYEGTLRSLVLHVDGWHDMHLHARIDSARDT